MFLIAPLVDARMVVRVDLGQAVLVFMRQVARFGRQEKS
tara:strand:+ start:89 stop:205 length:117 start_codon:yes stop_codon:yes gene_type:complete